ncbi:7551_t:CDS:1, partial [Cetraspora pellucida]
YPNCKFLFEYKRDEEQNNKRKHDESFNLDNEESFSSNDSENSNK